MKPAGRLRNFARYLGVTIVCVATLASSPAHARTDWPLDFWKDFIQIAADQSLTDAFGGDGFALLQSLTEIGESRDPKAQPLKQWLLSQMRDRFQNQKRTQANVFKGFFTCIDDGNCAYLNDLDANANIAARPFTPDLNILWRGAGQPAGTINWRTGRFADLGQLQVVDAGWDSNRGAYRMDLVRTARPRRLGASVRQYQLTIEFYSPCSFVGFEVRSFGTVTVGGMCPDHPCVSTNSCMN